jgi:hypothetical protein
MRRGKSCRVVVAHRESRAAPSPSAHQTKKWRAGALNMLGRDSYFDCGEHGNASWVGFHHRLLKLIVGATEDGGGIVVTEP